MTKIYIIILNYNGWKDTLECLESVLKNDYSNYQIIVVDNNSPNGSMDFIIDWAEGRQEPVFADNSQLKHFSQPFEIKPLPYVYYTNEEAGGRENKTIESSDKNPLIFIQAGENRGFAAGNNLGIKYALARNDFDYIWLLNNDTVIEKDALSRLVTFAHKHEVGICGSILKYYYEPEKIQAFGGGRVNKFFGTATHVTSLNEIDKIDYVVGAAFLINAEVIKKIGLLPEEYFLYYEETDYCFNAKQNGFNLAVAPDSKVYHKEGAATGANSSKPAERSEFSDVLSLKNRIRFHRKYLGGGPGLWSGIFISFLIRISRGQTKRIFKVLKTLLPKS